MIVNVVGDYPLGVTILKQKLSKIAKSRLRQGSRGANLVATINESAYEIYFVLARSKRIPFGVKASECLLPVDGCHETLFGQRFTRMSKNGISLSNIVSSHKYPFKRP